MKKAIFFFVLSFCLSNTYSQLEAANWYFGWNAGVNFSSGNPIALNDGALHTNEGCSSISDAFGNLLFYTDGITVWNRNHQPMPNGSGLLGDDDSTQSGLIVPQPNTPGIYYVFTVDKQAGNKGMNYSEVDMSLNGGLGDVTSKKNINLIPRSLEKVTAVKNQGGSGIWVIGHPWDSNKFYAYLVTDSGINIVPVESITPLTLTFPPGSDGTNSSGGQLKVSPDGTKIGMCSINIGSHLFDFDPQSGLVSNMVQISSRRLDYGIEFSPSGNVLYVSWGTGNGSGELYQYNVNESDIVASEVLIAKDYNLGYALQLAIDGKIYTTDSGAYLSSIDNPNVLGMGCNFNFRSVDLNGRWVRAGLPPFIQSFFYVDLDIRNLCFGDVTEFYPNSTGSTITSIFWDFGDGNTSALETPTHIYSLPGDYTVSVTVNTTTGSTTDTKDITINKTPVANLVTDFEICSVLPNYEFDLSTKDLEVLDGQAATDFTISYYPTMADAQNETNPLSTLYTNTNPTETIFARISNTQNPTCYDTTSFDLILKEAPTLNPVGDWTVCDTDADGFYDFDLSQMDSQILNGQSSSTFSVTYYTTQTDADAATNTLGANYRNTNSPEQVFFRIKNSLYPECHKTGIFNIEVITTAIANDPTDIEICDDNNDGISVFNLFVKDAEILSLQKPASFNVSYHVSQIDADAGANPLEKTAYTNTAAYNQTIFARVSNNGNYECYDTVSFSLRIFDSAVVQNVTDWQVCDDNNDGTYDFDLREKNTEILGGQSAADFKITYYETQSDTDANSNGVAGTFQNTDNPQRVFYRIENSENAACFETASFVLEVFETPTAGIPLPIVACDENESGIKTFDLSVKDAEVLNGQNPNTFIVSYFASQNDADYNQNPLPKEAYTNSQLNETIYARLYNINGVDCFDTTKFEINLKPLPQPNLEETYVICPDSPELIIDGGDFETWSWRNDSGIELETARNISITDLGDYTLTVTHKTNDITCEKTIPFEVVSSGAPEDFTTEIGDPSDNVSIIVNTIGTGEFEYSTDGENFQDGNRLEVFPGTRTVYVRDKFLCRTISKKVIALGYQKFFTPNNDGTHENWNIIGAYNYPESQLYIYDRYGKLLQQVSPMTAGWDGSYNGLPLPESDYWFRYIFDGGKVFTGHFSLKR